MIGILIYLQEIFFDKCMKFPLIFFEQTPIW